jgi:hypothetical protein
LAPLTSAAKADSENVPVLAAVNRCATRNQDQRQKLAGETPALRVCIDYFGTAYLSG